MNLPGVILGLLTFWSAEIDYRVETHSDRTLRTLGRTEVFVPANASKPAYVYDWIARDLFVYPDQANSVVAFFGNSGPLSAKHTVLAFYQGPVLVKKYSVADLKEPDPPGTVYSVPMNPIKQCWGRLTGVDSTGEKFFAEMRRGVVLGFDIKTGNIVSTELRFRSLCFSEWFQRGSNNQSSKTRKLIVGELYRVDHENSVVQLVSVNNLMSGQAFGAYQVKAALTQVFLDQAKPGSVCGLVVDVTPQGDIAREALVFPSIGLQ